MIGLFAASLFLSAALMFVAEPMIGKLMLPLLGGAPAVWNTCVMFFQAVLLLGYLYAHFSAKRFGLRTQVAIQLAALGIGLIVLPLGLAGGSPSMAEHPISAVLVLLTRSTALPLLALAASAPLLQQWLSTTRDPSAKDPFFLYAASNLGSLIALVAYPFVIEPGAELTTQRSAWTAGYLALMTLTAICGWRAYRSNGGQSSRNQLPNTDGSGSARTERLSWARRGRWIALAFVPSTLMLSVTTYVSTDIAAVPLLWVVPLGLYLVTFVLAFSRRQVVSLVWASRLLPFALVYAVFAFSVGPNASLVQSTAGPLSSLALAAFVCHRQLADDRPSTDHLTEYYLWISASGLLGGVFNTLIAPLIFTRTLEYPIGLVLAAVLRPRRRVENSMVSTVLDVGVPVLLAAWVFAHPTKITIPYITFVGNFFVWLGLPLVISLLVASHRLRFAGALAAILVARLTTPIDRAIHEERSFFGTHRIVEREPFRELVHGTTMHGMQALDPAQSREPRSYYSRGGPIGQIFESFSGFRSKFHIASVGLGAGTMAAYAQPYQDWTFFELNPTVVRLAEDPRYFTYLRDCAAPYTIVVGDARLQIARQPDAKFDVMVFDAFSSDAIPVHLATREALALYLRKLRPGGLLAFHITNRFLNLDEVFGNLAKDAGLTALIEHDVRLTQVDVINGKSSSIWVVLARNPVDFGEWSAGWGWAPAPTSNRPVWTDSYSNIITALRLFRDP